MGYEAWIAMRYLTAKKEPFLAVINFVAVAGVAIGVAALIVVIAVMTGFDNDLRDKIIGTNAHLTVEKEIGISNFRAVQQEVAKVGGVVATAPYVQGPLFIEYDGQSRGVMGRGIDPVAEPTVTKTKQYLKEGSLDELDDNGIIIGSELAVYLGKNLGNTITIIAPASGLSGEKWRHDLKIVGIFNSGMYDYDMNLVLMNIPKAQEIFKMPQGAVGGIAIKIKNVYEAPAIKKALYKALGYSYFVKTWIDSNKNFFAALKLEKFAMFIILTLIVLVASFNIVSTLIVTVTTKIKDIGILKAIGTPRKAIEHIFILKGLSIGFLGTFWGCVGGIGLSLILRKYQFIKLPQDIYYIDRLPVVLEAGDLLTIAGAAILISLLATIYPARKAGALEPVEALRYE